MDIETFIQNYVDALTFYEKPFDTKHSLTWWADELGVPHDEDSWLRDDWIDKEYELRVNLVDRIMGVR